jgi:RNA polymerase sigma-70 factor (ECF subfamily)
MVAVTSTLGLVREEPRDDPDLKALRAGDATAFRALVEALHAPLYRLAFGYLKDHAAAEDVVQETWLTCLTHLDHFAGRSSLRTWIVGIGLNLARSRRRKERRWLPFTRWAQDRDPGGPAVDPTEFDAAGMWKTGPATWAATPEDRLLGQETLRMLRAAIDALPAAQRDVVVLRDIAGLDAAEACEALGISASNQRVRLHRGRAAIRKMLADYLR